MEMILIVSYMHIPAWAIMAPLSIQYLRIMVSNTVVSYASEDKDG